MSVYIKCFNPLAGSIILLLLFNILCGHLASAQIRFPDEVSTSNRDVSRIPDASSESPEEDTGLVNVNQPSSADSCITYTGASGTCIVITKCAALRRLRDFAVLRRSLCGFQGDEPKLCCPNNVNASGSASNPTNRQPGPVPSRNSTRITTTRPATVSSSESHRPTGEVTSTSKPTRVVSGSSDNEVPPQLPSNCGYTDKEDIRIVGGAVAKPGAWPWMAALMVGNAGDRDAKCGSALIAPDVIITAAHCVVKEDGSVKPANQFSVRLGEHDIDTDSPDDAALEVDVVQVIAHSQFDLKTFKNDIALLRLRQKVAFNSRIAPVCLPYDSQMLRTRSVVGRTALITGWGRTAYQGVSSSVLLEASLKIVSDSFCRNAFKRWVNITEVYMCAASEGFDKDACQGDSGGPMVMFDNQKKRWYLMGIVSFGRRCAAPNTPGVYTRITKFLNWINEQL